MVETWSGKVHKIYTAPPPTDALHENAEAGACPMHLGAGRGLGRGNGACSGHATRPSLPAPGFLLPLPNLLWCMRFNRLTLTLITCF